MALRSEALARGEALKAAEADKAKLAAEVAAVRDQIAAKRGEADKCAKPGVFVVSGFRSWECSLLQSAKPSINESNFIKFILCHSPKLYLSTVATDLLLNSLLNSLLNHRRAGRGGGGSGWSGS